MRRDDEFAFQPLARLRSIKDFEEYKRGNKFRSREEEPCGICPKGSKCLLKSETTPSRRRLRELGNEEDFIEKLKQLVEEHNVPATIVPLVSGSLPFLKADIPIGSIPSLFQEFPITKYQTEEKQLYFRNDTVGVCLVLEAVGLKGVEKWDKKIVSGITTPEIEAAIEQAFNTADLLCRDNWPWKWVPKNRGISDRATTEASRHVLESFYAFVQGFKNYHDKFPFKAHLKERRECKDVSGGILKDVEPKGADLKDRSRCVRVRTKGVLAMEGEVKYDDREEATCFLVKCYKCCNFRKGGQKSKTKLRPFVKPNEYFRIDSDILQFTGLTSKELEKKSADIIDQDMGKRGRYVGEHIQDKAPSRGSGPDAFSNLILAWNRFNLIVGSKDHAPNEVVEIKRFIYGEKLYEMVVAANAWCEMYTVNEFFLDKKNIVRSRHRVAFQLSDGPHFHENAKRLDDTVLSEIDAAMSELIGNSKHCATLKGPT
eukprot:CAMPEP_0184541914 /NCGR_PEP_ID=MMETSP0199_2-20130426/1680_1 /TAXON_ID=1112570 /ORGANISM="Thraustochytrium sp., Strain LLF1b" /LENGTH=484 /DNA_ID=CAMNT_0026935671 /DNA_START=42 /DNA_END=1496 /DNA_ORIENTATION=+